MPTRYVTGSAQVTAIRPLQAAVADHQQRFWAMDVDAVSGVVVAAGARWHANQVGLEIGPVGTTRVACREHRGHEVDVVALDRGSSPRSRQARIVLLGEAKATNELRGSGDLARLRHIREVLVAQGWDAADAKVAVFSRHGFVPELRAGADDEHLLLDLAQMYGVGEDDA